MKRHSGLLRVEVAGDGRVSVEAKMSEEIFKEGSMWISHCPALDLSTCGKTKKEALENTREAVQMFFESCIRRRTLDKALRELEWKRENLVDLDVLAASGRCVKKQPKLPPAFIIDKVKDKTWRGAVTW